MSRGSPLGVTETRRYLNPPPEYIEQFHFGFRESVADSLWLRWIQDSDACQAYLGAPAAQPIPQAIDGIATPRNKFCDNSWGFKMLDAVTKLAPRFKVPYLLGAVMLSVLVEDYEGAKIIFDRGIENYPTDWSLLYRASYHYLFDRHDLVHAAELLERAKQAGAPYWLSLLAARLYSKAGQAKMGIPILENLRKSLTNEEAIRDIDRRIQALKDRLNESQ